MREKAPSSQMRSLIVGDVHGCFDELMLLLQKAGYQSRCHRLILLGDLINKGPDSFKVLSHVRQNNVEALIGNHEWKFIQDVEKNLSLPIALEHLKKDMGSHLNEWLDWMKSWPVYIEDDHFLAVHGGLVPGEHPGQSKVENLVNIRYWDGEGKNMKNPSDPAWHDLYTGSKLIVYAHWAQQGLKIKENSICLDTGCVYGGYLTGLWLPERELVQVPSLS